MVGSEMVIMPDMFGAIVGGEEVIPVAVAAIPPTAAPPPPPLTLPPAVFVEAITSDS